MERDPWGGPSVLMWSRIGLSFKRELVIFQSIDEGKDNGVMGALYIDQGLIPYVGPLERHFPPWHRSCSFWKNHNQNNMVVMPWPALNPGYNLIEHRWSEIQKRIDEVQERSTTAAKLGAFFIRIYARIPMAFINHSMYRICVAVINTNAENSRCLFSFLISSKICDALLTKVTEKNIYFRNLWCLEICLKWISYIYN